MQIRDSVVIVTGASEGIGRALAKLLSEKGAKVILAARSADKLKAVEAVCKNSCAIPADMSKSGDIAALVKKTVEKFGRIDILVNNAGLGLRAPVESIDIESYRNIMDVNVFGALEAMQAVIPVMRAQGKGMILNVSSMVSKNCFPGLAAYASTKYALNALSLTARVELAKDGIAVSLFHPKMTATKFGEHSLGEKYVSGAPRPGIPVDTPEAVAEKIAEQIGSEAVETMM
ncbi:MAG: SDR family NAD(P)-dependent oxidoreductase [Patescibacteria group bacterium]|nr:SDR family NAD(P)-dependent oxidoreductase [Patescibacteria group bacterium]MDE1945966.1 SDR family NAD(P)-dependent oxidoreductase [Patescibacteria group bacterium]